MIGHIPEHAASFMGLFARLENVLRRNGYVKKSRPRAEIDWVQFAKELDEAFFNDVHHAQEAATLISEPPRIYYRDRGMQPKVQEPIRDVVDLFLRGVCQVRNNIVHGEKYVDLATPRDDALVKGAHWVLEQAIARHRKAKEYLATQEVAK
jgi:hypothetical protein